MADGSDSNKNMAAFDMLNLIEGLVGNTSKEPVLKSFTLEEIGNLIKEKKVKNIITMAGAGISTAAGIPDFRSPESGMYANLQKYNLPDPMAIFSIDFFRANPRPFFDFAKELYPKDYKPTKCHFFIRKLNDEGLLLRHYTQNVDGLESVAGVPQEKLVEAHGTFTRSQCIDCKKQYDMEHVKKAVALDNIPKCTVPSCSGVVKPDIVFFGESLPSSFSDNVPEDFPKCDLLIILGTSLAVAPFCLLVGRVNQDVPRLYLNKEPASEENFSILQYGKPENRRDVFVQDDCDESCMKLAKQLEWDKDIESLYEEAQNPQK